MMKATLLHRTVRSACVALLLVLGAASSADAEEVYWQGRQGRTWDQFNPFGDVNNWYTKAPLKGIARRAPLGHDTAIFARGAKQHVIHSSGPVGIFSMLFLSDLKRYTFKIENRFSMLTGGIFNQSPAPPRFIVSDTGILRFAGVARIKSGGHGLGKRSAFIEIPGREGQLDFTDSSRGGNASVTNRGSISFKLSSSAERMMITNVGSFDFGHHPVTRFFNRSTGGSARFVNGRQGTLDFSTTIGPARDNNVTAGSIYNDGDLRIGINTLTVDRFEQTGGGDLSIAISGNRPGSVRVKGKAFLDGDLDVLKLNARPGNYTILYAEGGRVGTFTLANVNNGRLAYSANEVRFIIDP